LLYEIAFSLRIPVYQLTQEMPYDEFLKWVNYFENRPYEWRSDLRTAYVMKTFGDKRSPTEIFPSLSAVFSKKNETVGANLAGSALLNKLMSSKSGKLLEF
jgi:hypothetical protein